MVKASAVSGRLFVSDDNLKMSMPQLLMSAMH